MTVVSLLTDFGTYDGYVGAMKGVILGIDPSAVLVDITHDVGPQDVWEAAFTLGTAWRYFPPGTVHVVVVDPGVGTDRAAVILQAGGALFVAPDNGLLSFVLAELGTTAAGEASVPDGCLAFRITESQYFLPNQSNTFHGRDIFAPVAAHLSRGEPPDLFGPPIETLRVLGIPEVRFGREGAKQGEVIHVDRFGNLITNLRAADLPSGQFAVEAGAHRIEGLVRTYAEGRALAALLGSSGYLEIALPGGSCARLTGLGVGAPVRVLPGR